MITIEIIGGLGNQLFQYAYGKSLAHKFDLELQLDLQHLDFQKSATPREFQLNSFETDLMFAKKKHYIQNLFFRKTLNKFNKFRLKKGLKPVGNVSLKGYWQSENFFENVFDSIRKDFKFKPLNSQPFLKVKNEIGTKTNSVCIHIRRGDYMKLIHSIHNVCTENYFNIAITMMNQQLKDIHFFIFSDDIPWCKQFASNLTNVTFVEQTTGLEDLRLMTFCKHNIISNSSFSWWGAWLGEEQNPKKLVIAPNKWLNDRTLNHQFMVRNQIIPDRWRTIEF